MIVQQLQLTSYYQQLVSWSLAHYKILKSTHSQLLYLYQLATWLPSCIAAFLAVCLSGRQPRDTFTSVRSIDIASQLFLKQGLSSRHQACYFDQYIPIVVLPFLHYLANQLPFPFVSSAIRSYTLCKILCLDGQIDYSYLYEQQLAIASLYEYSCFSTQL